MHGKGSLCFFQTNTKVSENRRGGGKERRADGRRKRKTEVEVRVGRQVERKQSRLATCEPGSILPASTPEDARRPSRILVVVVVVGGDECTTLTGVASVRARGRIISRS